MRNKNRVGERVRKLREARNLRQADLAELIGTSNAWISAIETGASSITPLTIEKLTDAMDLSLRMVKALHRDGARDAGWEI